MPRCPRYSRVSRTTRAARGTALNQPLPPRTRLPAPVWWAVVAWACLMASWTLLLPTYRSADEAWHLDAARQVAEGKPWPGFKEMRLQYPVHRSLWNAGLGRDPNVYEPLLERDAVQRAHRPAFESIAEARDTRIVNQMSQHPPGYYRIAGGILRLLPDGLRYDAQAWLLRVFGVLLMVPLPLLAAMAVRRLAAAARLCPPLRWCRCASRSWPPPARASTTTACSTRRLRW